MLLQIALAFCLVSFPVLASETGNTVLKGRVTDAAGMPADGALVYVYSSPDVRRSADFISPPADKDGLFRIVALPGKYWAVARLKKIEGFGPLMPGDKHSGDPKEVELAAGEETTVDFVVVDLKDALSERRKDRQAPVRIGGRIINEKGEPVRDSYAIAHKSEKVSGIPEHVSAWVDGEGRYTLMLPKGKYYIGSAVVFPPGGDLVFDRQITVDGDHMDVDIVRRSGGK